MPQLRILSAILCLLVSPLISAEPDRESLLTAWADMMQSMPSTRAFEARETDSYFLEDGDLAYEGALVVAGTTVRPMSAGEFSHMGLVEIQLPDLPAERLASQTFVYWREDRQHLYWHAEQQRWFDQIAYQESFEADFSGSFGMLSFMLNYGIWIFLIALIVLVARAVTKQQKEAQRLMSQSSAINDQAGENLDRSERLQEEAIEIIRESLALQKENTEVLRGILAALERNR